jgi:hypothetical protein
LASKPWPPNILHKSLPASSCTSNAIFGFQVWIRSTPILLFHLYDLRL